MSSVDSRALIAQIAGEVSSNPEVSALAGPAINDFLTDLKGSFDERDGLQPGSISAAGTQLFAAPRKKGPAGAKDDSGEGWTIREWGSATSLVLGIEHFLGTYIAPLFSGIGDGRPAENEERIEQDQDDFSESVEQLRCSMEDGGQSVGTIVESTELSSNVLLQLALRVLKTARLTTPLGISGTVITELVLHALQNAKDVNEDANSCIGEILDQLGDECEELAERDPEPPCETYTEPKADRKVPDSPPPVVPEPVVPEPDAVPNDVLPPTSGGKPSGFTQDTSDVSSAPASPVAPEKPQPSAVAPVVEQTPTTHEAIRIEETNVALDNLESTSLASSATTTASAGLTVNFNIDVDFTSSGQVDIAPLEGLAPKSVEVQDVQDMMQGPMGQLGCARVLGALSLISAEFFESCSTELCPEPAPEQQEEPVVEPALEKDCPPESATEPEAPPAPPAPESETEAAQAEPEPEYGVIPPPKELADVAEPPPPPKKESVEPAAVEEPQQGFEKPQSASQLEPQPAPETSTEAAASISPDPPSPEPSDPPESPEPQSRVRKVDSF
ncbi:hypothetical protein [Corynebacterium lubricantis]|uniref:hypothetical protein n=1 Tax=Corynebacterium lubricantis TaxID=541095 RepID=UPI000381F8C1|nr:hypothetical protein [Corynebacterium lubricantis]